MEAISAFFMQNIVYVYFFYGLAFFALGLVVFLESGRASEFRFARALRPLAYFGFLHGGHEWFEMFQIFAAHGGGTTAGLGEELVRIASLAASFLLLLTFGTRLLPGAEANPAASVQQVAGMGGLWLLAVGWVYWRYRPNSIELLVAADVLARYSLAIPGAVLAGWALLRERRDFHARGMSQYGQALLWAALAFVVYGVIGQLFARPSLVFPSQVVNSALFLRTFGIPVQLLRGLAAIAIAVTLGSALRAFEMEGRLRLSRANKARIEAQAEALEAQQRRADDVEALNVVLRVTARELSAMVELSRILASTMDLRRLLRDALYQIVHSFEGAGSSAVYLAQTSGALELAGEYQRPSAPRPTVPLLLQDVVSQAVATGRATGAGVDGQVVLVEQKELAAGRTYQTLGIPLRAKEQILGGVALSSMRNEELFGPNELNLFNAFAQQIAASVENARLYGVVRERERQLEDLVRQLVNAQEGERQRIARELHDETGQTLTALAMGLAAVEAQLVGTEPRRAAALVHDLRGLSDHAIVELRNIMADLRPAQLDDLGLVPALRWYIAQYQARYPGLTVSLVADRSLARMPSQIETVFFRTAQEALTNIARHARATEATVAVKPINGFVRMEVDDNGVGFDVNTPSRHAPGSGLGLVGMRERVALVGGRCIVESQRGHGTRIVVELPVQFSVENQDQSVSGS